MYKDKQKAPKQSYIAKFGDNSLELTSGVEPPTSSLPMYIKVFCILLYVVIKWLSYAVFKVLLFVSFYFLLSFITDLKDK
jgi:hypothetical protein